VSPKKNGANTTQKPRQVLDALDQYYLHANANIHRATHLLSERATEAYEGTRAVVKRFINAADTREVVFTKGCTEGINLVASSWGRSNLRPGDEVLLTWMEHHSNIVPWQLVCEQTGATLKVCPITDRGELDLKRLRSAADSRTKLVSMIHVSNSLRTINPVASLTARAAAGAVVLVDGARAVAHMPVDVQASARLLRVLGAQITGPRAPGALRTRGAARRMPPTRRRA
jgi:cysteine desulfurase/selenocysteine lyase